MDGLRALQPGQMVGHIRYVGDKPERWRVHSIGRKTRNISLKFTMMPCGGDYRKVFDPDTGCQIGGLQTFKTPARIVLWSEDLQADWERAEDEQVREQIEMLFRPLRDAQNFHMLGLSFDPDRVHRALKEYFDREVTRL